MSKQAPPLWWPKVGLPANVSIVQTERGGPGWGFNLGSHVGAPDHQTRMHRAALLAALPGVQRLQWLRQVHGRAVIEAPRPDASVEADAVWTTEPGVACAVMTADCLPILLWRQDGSAVAAVHAGWRGLADGVIEATLASLPTSSALIGAWLGPRIGPEAFEVGAEVRDALMTADPGAAIAFGPAPRADHYLADLATLARRRLAASGVQAIHDSVTCTVTEAHRWFSYRREDRCGRMASVIWRHPRVAG